MNFKFLHQNLILSIFLLFSGCAYNTKKEPVVIPNPVVIDTLFFKDVDPIFEKSGCKDCHAATGGYKPTLADSSSIKAFASSDSLRLFKAIKYEAGDGKNMPPSGKISETDINKIVTWVRQGIKP
jgi:uncharacterized membrane protein